MVAAATPPSKRTAAAKPGARAVFSIDFSAALLQLNVVPQACGLLIEGRVSALREREPLLGHGGLLADCSATR